MGLTYRAGVAAVVVATAAAFAGCDDGATACTPGEQVACACPGGEQGVQVCLPSAEAFGQCDCANGSGGDASTSTSTSTSTGATSSGAGGGGPCTPGVMQACYEGPAGTEGMGVCAGGLATCNPDGMGFGACVGQVLPGTENCSTPEDEDCDGATPACNNLWSYGFGSQSFSGGHRVATNALGEVAIFGQAQGLHSIAGEPAQQYWRIYVAKFDASGNLIYSLPIGDPIDFSEPWGLALDDTGNVFVSGRFQDELTIGSITVDTSANEAFFIAKLDPDGDAEWAKPFEATIYASAPRIVALPSGNILTAGFANGQIYFGGPEVLTVQSGMYLLELDADGDFVWNDSHDNCQPPEVAVAPNGDILVAGRYENAPDFGGGPLPMMNSAGGLFFARFDSMGLHLGSEGFPTNNQALLYAAATDSTGGFALLGRTSPPIDFGGGPLPGNQNDRGFFVKFDATGAFEWQASFVGSMYPPAFSSLSFTSTDELLVGGTLRGTTDFGGGTVTSFPSSEAPVVLRFGSSGTWVSQLVYSDELANGGVWDVAAHPDGTVVFVGNYTGPFDFGQGPLSATGAAFVAKEAP